MGGGRGSWNNPVAQRGRGSGNLFAVSKQVFPQTPNASLPN